VTPVTLEYDRTYGLALIYGPGGGFTQIPMTEQAAHALASVLGVVLQVVETR
jgi:hypothetical protein